MRRLQRSGALLTVAVLLAACGARTMRGGRPDASVTPPTDQQPVPADYGVVPDNWPQPVDWGGPWGDYAVPPPPDWGPYYDYWVPPPPDFGVPDGPQTCTAQVGGFCRGPGDCCPGLQCFLVAQGAGVCSVTCTEDDPYTPLVNEDSCDLATQRCIGANMGQPFCALRCSPALNQNPCPGNLACDPSSAVNYEYPDEAYCLLPKCTSGADCPIYLGVACSPNDPTACSATVAGAICQRGRDMGFECALSGVCDAVSGICAPHQQGDPNAAVGGPCKSDLDCGGQMFCERQRNAAGRVQFRNGYCKIEGCSFPTLPQRNCPQGSSCLRLYPGGRCHKTCNLSDASTCRGNSADEYADYECYAWDNLSIGGNVALSDASICDSPWDEVYQLFGQSPEVGCEYLGLYPGNDTNMAWRNAATGAEAPPGSPGGSCLDDTASGPL